MSPSPSPATLSVHIEIQMPSWAQVEYLSCGILSTFFRSQGLIHGVAILLSILFRNCGRDIHWQNNSYRGVAMLARHGRGVAGVAETFCNVLLAVEGHDILRGLPNAETIIRQSCTPFPWQLAGRISVEGRDIVCIPRIAEPPLELQFKILNARKGTNLPAEVGVARA